MSKVDEYRDQAMQCLRLVGEIGDERARLALVDMAQVWLKLAEQAEKNATLDLVYETPSRPNDVSVQ